MLATETVNDFSLGIVGTRCKHLRADSRETTAKDLIIGYIFMRQQILIDDAINRECFAVISEFALRYVNFHDHLAGVGGKFSVDRTDGRRHSLATRLRRCSRAD